MANIKKTSDEVKRAQGRRVHEKTSVEVPDDYPQMPNHLQEGAKLYWFKYMELYIRTNMITSFDGVMLEILCDTLAERDISIDERQMMRRKIKQSGKGGSALIYKTCNDTFAIHPIVKRIDELDKKIKDIARVMGLDPLNRSSIVPTSSKNKKSTRTSMKDLK